jgi:hypothetical protein
MSAPSVIERQIRRHRRPPHRRGRSSERPRGPQEDRPDRHLPDRQHNYLRYDTALASGWPIATGIVEGAARHLIADRLDITGARWSLAGAEAVLKLRALINNGDFEDYWRYHVTQEHQRHHAARYQQKYQLTA